MAEGPNRTDPGPAAAPGSPVPATSVLFLVAAVLASNLYLALEMNYVLNAVESLKASIDFHPDFMRESVNELFQLARALADERFGPAPPAKFWLGFQPRTLLVVAMQVCVVVLVLGLVWWWYRLSRALPRRPGRAAIIGHLCFWLATVSLGPAVGSAGFHGITRAFDIGALFGPLVFRPPAFCLAILLGRRLVFLQKDLPRPHGLAQVHPWRARAIQVVGIVYSYFTVVGVLLLGVWTVHYDTPFKDSSPLCPGCTSSNVYGLLLRLSAVLVTCAVAYIFGIVGISIVRFGRTGHFLRQPSGRAIPLMRPNRLPRPLRWIRWIVYGMVASKLAVLVLYQRPSALIALDEAHRAVGLLLVALMIPFLWNAARERLGFGRSGALMVSLLPFLFIPTQIFPIPSYVVLIYVSAFALLARLPEVPSERRYDIAVGILAVTLLSYSLSAVLFPGDVIGNILGDFGRDRNILTHRTLHGLTILPAFALFGYWLSLQARLAAGVTPGGVTSWKAIRRPLAVVVVAAFVGVGLHLARLTDNPLTAPRYDRYDSQPEALVRGEPVRPLEAAGLVRSGDCGACHAVLYKQWAGSTHANAVNRAFVTAVRDLEARSGRQLGRDCLTCHDPMLALASDVETALHDDARLARSEGVSCLVCHSMTDARRDARFSFAFPPAASVSKALLARYIDSNLMEHVQEMGSSAERSGAICVTCHLNVTVQHGREFLPRDTVTSFTRSEYDNEMPCYGCHMAPTTNAVDGYSWPDHQFLGVNTLVTLTSLKTDPDDIRYSDARASDIRKWLTGQVGLIDDSGAVGGLLMKSTRPDQFAPLNRMGILRDVFASPPLRASIRQAECIGGGIDISGEIASVHVGHDYPETLFANLQRVWVEARVLDSHGRLVGDSDPAGSREHSLGRIEMLDDGTWIPNDRLFDYTRLEGRVIPPGGSVADHFRLLLPSVPKEPLRVEYRLNYRRYSEEFAARMASPGLFVEPLVMAEASVVLDCSRPSRPAMANEGRTPKGSGSR